MTTWEIIQGDCCDEMRKMSDESVGCVVTSPPYNLCNSTGNGTKSPGNSLWKACDFKDGYAGYDDNLPHDEYVQWQRACLSEMMRLIPENGAIFYNHKWRTQNGLLQDRNDIVSGFPVRQIIIWSRGGGFNFNDGYFLPTYEVIYLICKPKFKLAPKANAWGDVWRIDAEPNPLHPAPFPLPLASRLVASTSAETILDPFSGIGTTVLAAFKAGRHGIGIEQDAGYCQIANECLEVASGQFSPRDYGGIFQGAEL